ncbi:hypothetical protein R1flu_024376 [Riccia fluitans]|uniref:Zinc finger PHD-type domain-containing protein n=1 Tax=Riccia fluitans TaxID=41844 RepID=A0ABD1XUS1_9MARC
MISVKRLCDSTGNQYFSVESRLPDGKLQCITRSLKFKCNARGFDDADARAKALRFAITTDTLVQFRAFIFSEQDAAAAALGRTEGSVSSGSSRLDGFLSVGSSPEVGKRRGIRSYVCLRQNRLTGLRFVVAMSHLENGRLRAVSFQDHSLVGAGTPDEALNKAVRFLRGVAFDSWRTQIMNDLMSRNHRETFGHRRERALKHVSAFVEIEKGEKVDCACGKNRSRGLMVACERCGAWEHAECQGFRSNKQIPADYICSACMRAEREDVVVIRLDEQGECANLQLEDLWTDVKPKEREGDESVCCICGCEDNQDFETMIHPTTEHACGDGAIFAHPACISATQHASNKSWTKQIARLGLCQICGDRLMKSPKEELLTTSGVSSVKNSSGSISPNTSQARTSRRAAKTDQSSRKRLRSALTNGGVAAKVEVAEREKRTVKSVEEESDGHPSQSGDKVDSAGFEANKAASSLLGRRFSDATVTVPIKKRKFQMPEVPRSPSPPPRSPSPSPMLDAVASNREASGLTGLNLKSELVQCTEDEEMLESGSLEVEAVTSPNVLNSGIGGSKDEGPAISEKRPSDPRSGASDVVTRHDNDISGNETPTLSRSLEQEDNAPGKEGIKLSSKSKPSENGRPQHDTATPPLCQRNRIMEDIHTESLLGTRGGAMIVKTEGKEILKEPLLEASKVVSQGGTSPDTHPPVRGNLYEKSRTSATDIDIRELDERLSVDGATRSSDLVPGCPIPAASVGDPDSRSDRVKCEKDVEQKESQSGDVEVKDMTRSSSASQGPSRDVRLHWDLNMDMEEWERPPEEDTGTFAGVGSALAVPPTSSADTDRGPDRKVGTRDPETEAPSTQADSARVVDSIVLEEEGTAPVEISHTDGECDVSSSDTGDAGTKPLEDSAAMESVVRAAPAEVHSAHVQEHHDLVSALKHESTPRQPLVVVEDSSPKKLEKSKAGSTPDDQSLSADKEKSGGEERGENLPLKGAVDGSTEHHAGAEVDADKQLKVAAGMLVDNSCPPEGQCSASTSGFEVGGKSSSDADSLGKFEVSKVKGSSNESVHATGASKTFDGAVNCDSSVLSTDNYDFVEYDPSDEEELERVPVEKPLPEKKVEGPKTAELAHPGIPREWNEAQVEEMEAEHVDYDDSGDSRDEEFGSEADERADGEWGGRAETLERHEEGRVETARRNPVSSPSHFETNAKGEVRSASDGQDNLHSDVLKERSAVPEVAEDVEMKVTPKEGLHAGKREPENVVAKDRHGEEKTPKDNPDSKSVEKVENLHGRDEKRLHEDRDPSSSAIRRGDSQNRTKSSGWDQLPEGFDNPDDALRAAKGNPVVRTGRGSPWGVTNGRGSSISPRGAPVSSRFGRGLRSDSISDRARSEDSWTREDHQHGIRGDDSLDVSPRLASPRDLGRGRTHGRGGSPVVRARGRMDGWMESPSGPTSPWGPNRHPSPPGRYNEAVGFGPRGPTNAAAVAAAKVESSGFVVAPDGTVTKAGTSSRGPPRPFQAGGRNGRGVMFNMGRGGPGMGMGVGMNLGGLRVNMGMGRGMGMGPGMGMNMGIGMGIGMGVGPGLGLGLPGRGGPGGRGMDVRYSVPYAGRGSGGSPLVEPSSSSRRGRSHEEYPDGWSRREERSLSPRKRRSLSRRSRSRSHSRSRSRTRSPRARTPPRPANSSGSGGAGDKSLKKRSPSPVVHKPELKVERAESPPARRSVPPPPKLPLPPPPPRSQRSPPAGLKRLSDTKRDGDRARSRDRERERERERPATRARTPPRRTSPHVVHGSALMDDRDRQLLAGIRHVSPSGGRHRPTESSGAVAAPAGANRDSPPGASSPAVVGRMGDGNSEGRRQSGDEGGESRVHVLRREEAASKLEQRSSKDTSRGERERTSRRDGGRDRDEERRDVSKMSYSSRDRDGRGSSSGVKYNREGDDDVAPRRRRPSP